MRVRHNHYRMTSPKCYLPGEPRSVNVYIPYELWERVDLLARKKNRSRAQLIRPYVIKAIERMCPSVSNQSDTPDART